MKPHFVSPLRGFEAFLDIDFPWADAHGYIPPPLRG
jgi:hypothetical protein